MDKIKAKHGKLMEMLNFQMLKLNEESLILYNKIQDKTMDVKK